MVQWEQLWVLGVGSFWGSCCKGVTGFGSAVILISCWVVARLSGIDAGWLLMLCN